MLFLVKQCLAVLAAPSLAQAALKQQVLQRMSILRRWLRSACGCTDELQMLLCSGRALEGLAKLSQHGGFAQQVPHAVPFVQGSLGDCSGVATVPQCWWLRDQCQQEAQPPLQLPPRCQVMQRPVGWSLSVWPTRALHGNGAVSRRLCQLSSR